MSTASQLKHLLGFFETFHVLEWTKTKRPYLIGSAVTNMRLGKVPVPFVTSQAANFLTIFCMCSYTVSK